MKKITGLAALLPTPLVAHDGAHLHPHGYETAAALVLLGVALALFAMLRVR